MTEYRRVTEFQLIRIILANENQKSLSNQNAPVNQ